MQLMADAILEAEAAARSSASWIVEPAGTRPAADILCRRASGGEADLAINFAAPAETVDSIRSRHALLAASGARTVWFVFAAAGKQLDDLRAVTFRDDGPQWTFAGVTLSTAHAVEAVLDGDFQFCRHLLLTGPYYVRLDPEWRACPACQTRYVDVTPSVLRSDEHGSLVRPAWFADRKTAASETAIAGRLVERVLARRPYGPAPHCSWRRRPTRGGTVWVTACPTCTTGRAAPAARTVKLTSLTYAVKASPTIVAEPHWCYAPGTASGGHCPNPSVLLPAGPASCETPLLVPRVSWGVPARAGRSRDLMELIPPPGRKRSAVASRPRSRS